MADDITVILTAAGNGTIVIDGTPQQFFADGLDDARTKAFTQLRELATNESVVARIEEPTSSFRLRIHGDGKVEPLAAAPVDEIPEPTPEQPEPSSALSEPVAGISEPSPETRDRAEEIASLLDPIMAPKPLASSHVEPQTESGTEIKRPRRISRRFLLRVSTIAAAVLVAGTAAVAGWTVITDSLTASAEQAKPVATSTAAPAIVTLPGYKTKPSWTIADVDAVGAQATRVLTIAGAAATLHEAATGDVIASTEITGDNPRVIAGTVGGTPTVAAVTDTQAHIWIDGNDAATVVDLSSGRTLSTRSGAMVLTGTDRSFWLLTAAGEAALLPPRPQMIVIGFDGDSVIWAGAPHQVVTSSLNGTILKEITLSPPAEGATVTPRTGWIRAVNGTTTVIGWTLPDGSTVTGVHSTPTGELLTSFPGAGAGILSPDNSVWVADGHRIDLTNGNATPLPNEFVASRFLGTDLYGADAATGSDALLLAGQETLTPAPPTTATPVAVVDGILLTLTDRELFAFPSDQ